MNKLTKAQKRLQRIYNKRLKKLHKQNFSKLNNNMEYFITYLQFMRDYYILTEDLIINGEENLKIATLAAAIAEYEEYKGCILNYYHIDGNKVEQIGDKPKEKVLEQYNKEKAFHWKYFWQLVLLNMEDWMGTDVTV